MQIVTLTSDWIKDDFYGGAVKGKILSAHSNVQVITLSSSVKSYSVAEAAFVLRNSFLHFPKGTVHLIAVNSMPSETSKMIAAKIEGQYIVSADNGLFGLLGDLETEEIIELNQSEDAQGSFPELDLFVPAVCSIIEGTPLQKLGKPFDGALRQTPMRATYENDTITGTVLHIDSYGNAITNITGDLFRRVGLERKFQIFVQSRHYIIEKLSQLYTDTSPGDLLALFNSIGLLEIAIRNGNASGLLNLNTDSTIRVKFKEK